MRRSLFLLPLFLLGALATFGQAVRWQPNSGTLSIGQVNELNLVFENCQPQGPVRLPAIAGVNFGEGTVRTENSQSIINGIVRESSIYFLSYRAQPTRKMTFQIPSFEVETTKGRMRVAPANFEVVDATVGAANVALANVAQSRLTLPAGPVWTGEIFPITYNLSVGRRYFHSFPANMEWPPAPLTVEEWAKPEAFEVTLGGEPQINFTTRTRAYAKLPGTPDLASASQVVNLVTGTSSFGVFSRPNLEQFSIVSKKPELTVRPLPTPAPTDFAGAVGQFTLTSKVVPQTAAAGEPITWTLELAGTGNWPDIAGLPARTVSKDFRVVQPEAKRTPKEGMLFEATLAEDIVLIPTKAGSYTIGPVALSIFDPATGAYKKLTTDAVTVTITAPVADPNAATTAATKLDPGAGAPPETGGRPAVTPVDPSALPREPLAAASAVRAPLAALPLVATALGAALVPLILWLVLAYRRARATDPARARRAARDRLAATLAQLRSAATSQPSTLNPQLLLAWQRDTVALFELGKATPLATDFTSTEWAALWAESERALYAQSATLPAGWLDRASTALATHDVPPFSPAHLFLPRNLTPFFAALTLVAALVALPGARAAEKAPAPVDPIAAYNKGDFAAAETAWRAALKTANTDWTAHHNLALALAQREQWSEAAAHAVAAFVQNPSSPAVRATLAYTLDKAALAPPAVAPFNQPDAAHAIARLLSPTQWQYVAIGAALLVAIALSLLLWIGYGGRVSPGIAVGLAAIATLLGGASAFGLSLYGPLADARTVIVAKATELRSIPTDLETGQQTTPLEPGVLGRVDKTYLTWHHLVFADGQSGWVRAHELVNLW